MSKKLELPKPTTGYGYVGVWSDGSIGWFMPRHIDSRYARNYPSSPAPDMPRYAGKRERAFLCKITVTPVTDKRGRPVTRIIK